MSARLAIRRTAALTISLLALLALPALAAANSKLKIGFLDNVYVTGQAASFWSDVDQLNVGTMRWDVQWKEIAPTRPTNPRDPADPAYNWIQTDLFVLNAAAHGLQDKVMFTLWRTPTWASSTKSKPAEVQMPRLKDWRAFVAATATRYSGRYTPPGASAPLPRVVAWETWNEPNAAFALRPQKVKGKPVSPRNYVKLLNGLKTEVNRAVPFKPTFVAGALYKQGGPRNLSPIEFMRGMKAAKATFDVLSVHPYNNTPKLGLNDGRGQSKTNPRFIGIGNFDTFITLANRIFGRKYPIWVTEFGWATPAEGKTQYTVSFQQQSRFLYESVLRFKQLPQVERMIWFLIEDNPRRTEGAWYTTGLRKADGTQKPSWQSWISAASKLRPAHRR